MQTLRFSPYAWAKLLFFRDKGDTEISCMGVTTPEDPTLVSDVRMPKQVNGYATTEFTETGLSDFFERLVEEGLHPANFGRIWCHTHPGKSASPSGTDVETFKREFSAPNWAIMFIIGKTGEVTCRLKHKNHADLVAVLGEFTEREVTVILDWNAPFYAGSKEVREQWENEYKENHSKMQYSNSSSSTGFSQPANKTEAKSGRVFEQGYYLKTHGRSFHVRRGQYGGTWISEETERDKWTSEKWYQSWDQFKREQIDPSFAKDDEPTDLDLLSEDEWIVRAQPGKKSPIGFYQPPIPSRSGMSRKEFETEIGRRLSKREKKYFNRLGTLEGFVPPSNYRPPSNNGAPSIPAPATNGQAKMVSLSKNETQKLLAHRNLLEQEERTEQSDEVFLSEEEFKNLQQREIDLNAQIDALIYLERDLTPIEDTMLVRWEEDLEDVEEQLANHAAYVATGRQALDAMQKELDEEDEKLRQELAADAVISTTHLSVFPPAQDKTTASSLDTSYDCLA